MRVERTRPGCWKPFVSTSCSSKRSPKPSVSEPTASSFSRALQALTNARVAYVVVGVSGINFYARTPEQAYATLDLDTLLEPTVSNLRTALRVLEGLGYQFEAGGEPFLDADDERTLRAIVANGATLSARDESHAEIDLLLSISGFSYSELSADAAVFRVAGAEVRVGTLEKLLQSKEASGRAKDRAFLRIFSARSGDGDD